MTAGLHYSKSISPTAIPSGDYWDTAEEDGLRIAGKVPITDVAAAAATTIKAVDAGLDYVGDTTISGGTGSTAIAAFSAAFTAIPRVVGTSDHRNIVAEPGIGSNMAMTLVATATGSAVFLGVSGVGVQWMAYGDKY